MIKYTCCDPSGVTFCIGCGDDIKHGRTLPFRRVVPNPLSTSTPWWAESVSSPASTEGFERA